MRHLIAYDIADPARLRRVARFLERHALRCQKSVFLFDGETAAVERVLDGAAELLDAAEDVIQAWRLVLDQPDLGLVRGTPLSIRPAVVLLARERTLFVERQEE